MDLDLSDDQVALRDGIASLLEGRFDAERVRAGFDAETATELAEAGVFSLRADGFSWADCVVVFEQLGRWCVPGPLVPSLLAGEGIATAVAAGDRWVEHAQIADSVYEVDDDALRRHPIAAVEAEPSAWPLDPLTPVSQVTFLTAGEEVGGAEAAREWRRRGAVLTAAFQLGLADRLTEMSVQYAQERVQFDRPIGSFQAVKHILADMLTRTEVARAAVYAAGAHLDTPDLPGVDRSVAGAKVTAGEAAIVNGKSATQVHGGMGFTWEVDVHLYFKRAWLLDTHFGTADAHADALAATLG